MRVGGSGIVRMDVRVVEMTDLPPTMKRVRIRTAAGSENGSVAAFHPYWFVLKQLYLASEQGVFMGYEKQFMFRSLIFWIPAGCSV